jgi:alpha-D-ribose 1-methylphosphonate 5-triphosphate synthase subunit PhnL
MIVIESIGKSFTLHNQGGVTIPVMAGAALAVAPGECVGLTGASGAGKSTLMRMVYGNYLSSDGRVVPRVPTLDVVAEPLLVLGVPAEQARARAAELLARLNIPRRLWSLSPTTFSGGEQQRVNIARGFAHVYPALLLDEPTASLDAANREVVLSLIEEAKARGTAILGIFHDEAARTRLCDRLVDVTAFTPRAAA